MDGPAVVKVNELLQIYYDAAAALKHELETVVKDEETRGVLERLKNVHVAHSTDIVNLLVERRFSPVRTGHKIDELARMSKLRMISSAEESVLGAVLHNERRVLEKQDETIGDLPDEDARILVQRHLDQTRGSVAEIEEMLSRQQQQQQQSQDSEPC